MEARDPELAKELDAALSARRDLGQEYESALVESFLEKLDRRMEATVDRRVRREVAELRIGAARGGRSDGSSLTGFGERFGFAVVSLVLAVPLSGIGAGTAGLGGLMTVWAGIVGINVAHSLRGIPTRRARRETAEPLER
ncbi:hypothetical protein C6N75_02715 [Streptomyces solincola]|uniref:Integral membrane protein n=1 Tax=Streptomyces solincola TaxID=2100817 RepID=A0A2S9Q220_9ACTN|nr:MULTISPECIES: hypothetical protein [Streptomyces]PRH80711.1 hypothetical protein C6N75_02715 [Streptomyces solincola]